MKEYKFTCNRCGNVWYVNKEQVDNLISDDKWDRRLGIANALFGLFGSRDNQNAADQNWQNRQRNKLIAETMLKCPNCRSSNFDSEVVE